MLSFNLGNPAGSPQARSGPATAAPLERIRAHVSKSQIVAMTLPFQTPRAKNVRDFVHARLLTATNQKIFFWRREMNNMWTNIALDSSPQAPKLTAPPVDAATALMTILPQCADVSGVDLFDDEGIQITLADVQSMAFNDLVPQSNPNPNPVTALPGLPAPTLHTLIEKQDELMNKVDEMAITTKRDSVQLKTDIDLKLSYIIDHIDGTQRSRDLYDGLTTPARQGSTSSTQVPTVDARAAEPATEAISDKAAGKRPRHLAK